MSNKENTFQEDVFAVSEMRNSDANSVNSTTNSPPEQRTVVSQAETADETTVSSQRTVVYEPFLSTSLYKHLDLASKSDEYTEDDQIFSLFNALKESINHLLQVFTLLSRFLGGYILHSEETGSQREPGNPIQGISKNQSFTGKLHKSSRFTVGSALLTITSNSLPQQVLQGDNHTLRRLIILKNAVPQDIPDNELEHLKDITNNQLSDNEQIKTMYLNSSCHFIEREEEFTDRRLCHW